MSRCHLFSVIFLYSGRQSRSPIPGPDIEGGRGGVITAAYPDSDPDLFYLGHWSRSVIQANDHSCWSSSIFPLWKIKVSDTNRWDRYLTLICDHPGRWSCSLIYLWPQIPVTDHGGWPRSLIQIQLSSVANLHQLGLYLVDGSGRLTRKQSPGSECWSRQGIYKSYIFLNPDYWSGRWTRSLSPHTMADLDRLHAGHWSRSKIEASDSDKIIHLLYPHISSDRRGHGPCMVQKLKLPAWIVRDSGFVPPLTRKDSVLWGASVTER